MKKTDRKAAARRWRLAGVWAGGLLLVASAFADDLSADEVLRLRQRGEVVPLTQLLQQLESRHPGAQVLDVELERDDGRLIYEIEVLTTQRIVRELEFDARDGRLLNDEVER
ncbi:MAG: PepSY domain-containing protein [Spongiibacteraceae bacterium]|jgi:uncharacterized membrane protein YkoI|nr:PepSY domain-containing protein [Spongiibacteraceae bacterium]